MTTSFHPSEVQIQYLLDYLKEEFHRYPEARIRKVPGISDEHGEEGVTLKTESREYFFPISWMLPGQFKHVVQLVQRIKSALPDRG